MGDAGYTALLAGVMGVIAGKGVARAGKMAEEGSSAVPPCSSVILPRFSLVFLCPLLNFLGEEWVYSTAFRFFLEAK
ncbi:MAG: hypothetical protein WGN25_10480 [Candidatus Electrothrix sp. GW3-4]|uniref:hypothetical protein n=1 Tax=Candidatus Electrothrix sp. GW3-4 TaxID=3126740 RepID=UPI0030CDF3B3